MTQLAHENGKTSVRLVSETCRNADVTVTFEWTLWRLKEQFLDCDGRVQILPSKNRRQKKSDPKIEEQEMNLS